MADYRGRGRGGSAGGTRGGGGFDGRGDPRGGISGGGGRGSRGSYSGGGGGGYSRGGGSKSKIVNCSDILPKEVTLAGLQSAPMGWHETTITDTFETPSSKGVGRICDRRIDIILNHMASTIELPKDGLHHYEVSIDLSQESKLKKKIRKEKAKLEAKDKDKGYKPKPKLVKSNNGRRTPDEPYNVKDMDPPKKNLWKKLTLKAVEKIESMELEIYRNKGFGDPTKLATDGMRAIYSAHPIRSAGTGHSMTLDIKVTELGQEETSEDVYIVNVSRVLVIPTTEALRQMVNDLSNYLSDDHPIPPELVEVDRIYNIALKTTCLRNLISVGRASFFPNPSGHGYPLQGGLVNWTGFSLTYTMGWKPFVTIDVANSAFILGKTVIEVLANLFGEDDEFRRGQCTNARDISRWTDYDYQNANDLLKTCKVQYSWPNGQKFTKGLTEVTKLSPTQHKFSHDGREYNVKEYFEIVKRMRLQYPNGPILKLGKDCYVPAEFCTVVKGQQFKHKLGEGQTANMIKDAAKPPADRMGTIQKAIRLCHFDADPVCKEFGITVDDKQLLKVNARILPPPTLIYGKNDSLQAKLTPGVEGVWDMFGDNLQFVQPFKRGRLVNWAVLNLADPRRCTQDNVERFLGEFTLAARKSGLELGDTKSVMKNYKQADLRAPYTRNLITFFQTALAKRFDFVLVIMPRKDVNIYSAIKKASELLTSTGSGILTQCVVANNVITAKSATVGNIILKLNMKLGGVNNLLCIDKEEMERIDILRAPVMIMGADVTHPMKDQKFPSFAAVTASTDRTGMPFMMTCQAQRIIDRNAAEIITGLDVIVKNMLARFIENTGHRPRKIIFYRDGVGDSQFDEVLNKEMGMIRKACVDLEKDEHSMKKAYKDWELMDDKESPYQPKITFVAVQKRHKTRFFPENKNDGVGKPQNAPPGTIVDSQITNPQMTDFYLLSHIGIQGTSRPTRYQVLWDDTDFKMDEIEVLTYYLCYCYCRCNRSVSYPAPTYYAHLAATRAKIYTVGLSDDELQNTDKVNVIIRRQPGLLDLNPMHFV